MFTKKSLVVVGLVVVGLAIVSSVAFAGEKKWDEAKRSFFHAVIDARNCEQEEMMVKKLDEIRKIGEKNVELLNDLYDGLPFGVYAAGAPQVIKTLLDLGYRPSLSTRNGYNALHSACFDGVVDSVRILLEHAPQLKEAADEDGKTPLHYLCRTHRRDNNPVQIFKLLINKSGVKNIDGRDKLGRTPLYYAAESGHRDLVSYLVGSGAKAGITDLKGWTCLHIAAHTGQLEVVEFLFTNYPGLLDKTDRDGKTAIDVTRQRMEENFGWESVTHDQRKCQIFLSAAGSRSFLSEEAWRQAAKDEKPRVLLGERDRFPSEQLRKMRVDFTRVWETGAGVYLPNGIYLGNIRKITLENGVMKISQKDCVMSIRLIENVGLVYEVEVTPL